MRDVIMQLPYSIAKTCKTYLVELTINFVWNKLLLIANYHLQEVQTVEMLFKQEIGSSRWTTKDILTLAIFNSNNSH